MEEERVYLDWAATTPLRREVIARMDEMAPIYANPSSLHTPGREAREYVDEARAKVAELIGAQAHELLFTAGATESCNLAVKGAAFASMRRGQRPHIVTSAFEHHAVLEPVKWLETMRMADITIVEPKGDGVVAAEDLVAAIRPDTILASLMLVNNEIGTIQPVAEVAGLLREVNEGRETPVLLHTDATQAIPYLPVDVKELGVDMLSLSGHKFGAPKGVGALYKRKGVRLQPLIHGGAHERGLRAGTENFLSIAGMAKALELTVGERAEEAERLAKLRDGFEASVLESIPRTEVNGNREGRSPHISNLFFADLEAEALLYALDALGIAASAGSACTSEELGSSHVLMSVFCDQKRADGSVRFSFGWETKEEHLKRALDALVSYVSKLRLIAGRT